MDPNIRERQFKKQQELYQPQSLFSLLPTSNLNDVLIILKAFKIHRDIQICSCYIALKIPKAISPTSHNKIYKRCYITSDRVSCLYNL